MIERRERRNYKRSSWILTFGVTTFTGLLSFSGMVAFLLTLGLGWPLIIPLALISAFFAIAVEGTIYFTNIVEALGKLFAPSFYRNELGTRFLNELGTRLLEDLGEDNKDSLQAHFSLYTDLQAYITPYTDLKNKIHSCEHCLEHLGKNQARKNEIKKEELIELKELKEKQAKYVEWFSWQLEIAFKKRKDTTYTHTAEDADLQQLLAKLKPKQLFYEERIREEKYDRFLIVSSVLIGSILGFMSTYGLGEFFALVGKWLPSLLLSAGAAHVIIPILAVVIGIGAGLRLYRTISKFMHSDFYFRWTGRVSTAYQNRDLFKLTGLLLLSGCLMTLAVMLTYFTGYTYWTTAGKSYVLFDALKKPVVRIVMGVLFAFSTINDFFFNIQNSAETVEELLGDKQKKGALEKFADNCRKLRREVREHWMNENLLQFINPFRLAKYLFINSLYSLFFIGHLISIGVSSDQVGNISKYWAVAVATVTEFFEDLHYLLGHDGKDEDEHHHGTNLLSRLASWIIYIPAHILSYCARGWDWGFSQLNGLWNKKFPLTWLKAGIKNRPIPVEEHHYHFHSEFKMDGDSSGNHSRHSSVHAHVEPRDGHHHRQHHQHAHLGNASESGEDALSDEESAGWDRDLDQNAPREGSFSDSGHLVESDYSSTHSAPAHLPSVKADVDRFPLKSWQHQQFLLEEEKERLATCVNDKETIQKKIDAISAIQEIIQHEYQPHQLYPLGSDAENKTENTRSNNHPRDSHHPDKFKAQLAILNEHRFWSPSKQRGKTTAGINVEQILGMAARAG